MVYYYIIKFITIFFLLNFVQFCFYCTSYSYLYSKPVINYWWSLMYKRSVNEIIVYISILSISTLPFTAYTMREIRYFEYFYSDYFIIIHIHLYEVKKWQENEPIIWLNPVIIIWLNPISDYWWVWRTDGQRNVALLIIPITKQMHCKYNF